MESILIFKLVCVFLHLCYSFKFKFSQVFTLCTSFLFLLESVYECSYSIESIYHSLSSQNFYLRSFYLYTVFACVLLDVSHSNIYIHLVEPWISTSHSHSMFFKFLNFKSTSLCISSLWEILVSVFLVPLFFTLPFKRL